MPPKPKKKCCVTKPRCRRCPIRLLAEGRLPDGYTVRKRRLVKTGDKPTRSKSKQKRPEPTQPPVAA